MKISEDESEMVTVGRFLDPTEAQMACGALEAAGIRTFLQGENANTLLPGAFRARVLVSAADEAAALELLRAADENDSPETAGDESA
jgi:hypothetical protein